MTTTHELAKKLMALPDMKLIVEGWISDDESKIEPKVTDYDDEVVILVQMRDVIFHLRDPEKME